MTNPSARRVAARYLGDPGGTLSWLVQLGGDPRNWSVNWEDTDGRSWNDLIKQIVRAFKSIRTRYGATVDDVSVKRDGLRVYFDYDKNLSAPTAFYESEFALQEAIKELSDRDTAMEWALHGTVDGRSNLEITDEAIEDGFEDKTASAVADLEGLPRRKVVQMVNHVISRAPLKGVHRDEYWKPVNALWKAFTAAGIPYTITKADYEHERVEGQYIPVRKVWQFEVPFTSEVGRPGTVYGRVIAAGAGPVGDPLAAYDVTAYAN